MKKLFLLLSFIFSSAALAAPILNDVITLDSGKERLIIIKTNVSVSVNIELIAENLIKAMDCKSCLHLAHKLSDGHIAQKNSSSIGVGFIKVMPENGQVQVIVSHNHPLTQKIKILVEEAN